MTYIDIDFEDDELADKIMRSIEKDYGRSIQRIPFFERGIEPNTFDIKVIFTDFRLLEAKIIVVPYFNYPSIQVHGTYY